MLTVLGFDGTPFTPQKHATAVGDRFIRTLLKLVPTGNYATGGDALDLTNNNGAVSSAPNTIPPAVGTGLVSLTVVGRGPTGGFSGLGGICILVPPNTDAPMTFADAAALKLKFLVSVGTEYTAGAYGAGVTGDEFIAEAIWAR